MWQKPSAIDAERRCGAIGVGLGHGTHLERLRPWGCARVCQGVPGCASAGEVAERREGRGLGPLHRVIFVLSWPVVKDAAG